MSLEKFVKQKSDNSLQSLNTKSFKNAWENFEN